MGEVGAGKGNGVKLRGFGSGVEAGVFVGVREAWGLFVLVRAGVGAGGGERKGRGRRKARDVLCTESVGI